MASRVYDTALNKMADALFASSITISARTADPGDAGTAGAVSGNGYKDVILTAAQFADAGAGAAAAGQVVATADADFGSASGGSWGTITHLLLRDGTKLVGWVTLDNPRTVNDGDGLLIPAAEISFRLTAP